LDGVIGMPYILISCFDKIIELHLRDKISF